ncbi:MAG: ATP-grasp domain-containing protein, partial [archaeon]|nr:ATP-grasp domain-containing protein [archaeon]
GDSTCVIPPQSLSTDIIEKIRDYVRSIALALQIKGLLNVQMAVKDGVVYVLEVNPRASRTIPYVAKATGIPLAKLAAKVMLGHKLRELEVKEWDVEHVAVKEVVLPFPKLRGVDTLLGPEMKSTGEVMGIDYGFDKAFFKAELAADNPLPVENNSTVFISVCNEDKEAAVRVARNLKEAGLSIVGTAGTVTYLKERGIDAGTLKKLQEKPLQGLRGRGAEPHIPNVVELMHSNRIKLVINTPTDKQSYKDGYQIRRSCIDLGIPYITTMQAAKAAAAAILGMEKSGGGIEVKSLNEYFAP